MKVYLSGGFKSNWQDEVKKKVPKHEFYDPRYDTEQKYYYTIARQDLDAIDKSDLLFVYFEYENPSGLGLSVEIGYALAKGKRIIIIDEHEIIHVFLASCCEKLFTDLRKAIEWLSNN